MDRLEASVDARYDGSERPVNRISGAVTPEQGDPDGLTEVIARPLPPDLRYDVPARDIGEMKIDGKGPH